MISSCAISNWAISSKVRTKAARAAAVDAARRRVQELAALRRERRAPGPRHDAGACRDAGAGRDAGRQAGRSRSFRPAA